MDMLTGQNEYDRDVDSWLIRDSESTMTLQREQALVVRTFRGHSSSINRHDNDEEQSILETIAFLGSSRR